ncbi:MAG: hypothetical protein JSR64_09730 [Nitrospira sp.]|nr:hypothetical protein [Nitrospira sp.]MBS0194370.1 hypothetical protein [Pseudomonadota bacterium]
MNAVLASAQTRGAKALAGSNAQRFMAYALLVAVGALVIAAPEQAHAAAAALQKQGTSALSWIKTGVGLILTVAVLGSGVLAAFGQMSWKTVGQILIGCIVAGMCTVVVAALYTP